MLQKDLLLPWRTVLDNVASAWRSKACPWEARERACRYLERYGLGGFEHRYPRALSGGMRQRAALLRTLLLDTDIILLDEPFGALDAQTKAAAGMAAAAWSPISAKTVVFVTHDVEEAIFLSDEICVGAPPGRMVEPHRRSICRARAPAPSLRRRRFRRSEGYAALATGHSGAAA